METKENDFSLLGLGILGALFGIYDKGKAEEMKAWFGAWVNEQGGSEKVWEKYRSSLPSETHKEKVIESLEECVRVAIEKGVIKNNVLFKRDYKIVIAADNNDNVYFSVSKKGESVKLTDDDRKIVSEMISEINEKTKTNK